MAGDKHANVAFFIPHLGCPHRCAFCDQRAIAGQPAPTPEQVKATAGEALARMGGAARRAEIAFFGGSFTALPRKQMTAYLAAAAEFVGPEGFAGIRLSTRPDAVDAEITNLLRRYGVTAVELGAQSMDDRVLARNGRGHTALDVERAAALLRGAGMELGLQMMTGLYGDTPAGARETARRLAALTPRTVRVYPTLALRGTRLEDLWRRGAYSPETLPEAVELCAGLLEFFEERGIRVIRMGLHATRELQENVLAGPLHPAFRELCESALYRKKALPLLRGLPPGSRAVLLAAPGELSKLVGQRRRNITALEDAAGLSLTAREDASLTPRQIALELPAF